MALIVSSLHSEYAHYDMFLDFIILCLLCISFSMFIPHGTWKCMKTSKANDMWMIIVIATVRLNEEIIQRHGDGLYFLDLARIDDIVIICL